jgi:small subunit ribosomal protein S6
VVTGACTPTTTSERGRQRPEEVLVRRYEMMMIVTDTIDEDAAKAAVEKAKKVLAQQGGNLLDEAWWGRRKLAYEINKRDHGYYAVLDLEATSEAVDEVERQLKISDDVVRFKTVRPETRVRSRA